MARKVGFDEPDTEKKKSIANRYLDEFRAKSSTEIKAKTIHTRVTRDWFTVVFLLVWLAGWTFGILFCVGALVFGSNEAIVVIFLFIWAAAACAFWLLAVKALIKELRGNQMRNSGSGT